MNENELFYLLLLLCGILFAIWLYRKLRKPDITKLFTAKTILTDREYEFYKRLKPLADEYGLNIYTKVRLADLIEPKPKEENPFWMECFNKIKSKHIDFALADEETAIVALIELDDTSHSRPDREKRDDFVNAVLENTGYTLLRTYGELDVIEEYLR
ncbi:MAG: DUF2726 domain-containing protein [Ruminococcus sp.]|uniref:DUF2726 domain-containing protein n=1 Tax=Ruminococcus sp. TaxID=41978 RepID=UPI001B572BC5|nr:DUF2726 domain-containing protein [Ruminococcus sp.]MBO4492950.1 DUF2726 domain-containing protein [Ruminococcus sp.]MBP5431806.1 DUF2726 domain-containing protein [Ruminococcus sp.]